MKTGKRDLDGTADQRATGKSHDDARGRHVLFLGYAPGVGKTFAMLREGQRLRTHGEDVVLGLLEPHARPETMALAEDFERLPLLGVDYHGACLGELDVRAALVRRPGWLMVDELAHENVGEGCSTKRWESVPVLLDAGINVMSTLNTQHLDSFVDFMYQITGARSSNTVPDSIVAEADEIVFIDLAVPGLLMRVKEGKVCAAGERLPAMTHFFRPTVLESLRDETRAYVGRLGNRVVTRSSAPRRRRSPWLRERIGLF